MTSGPEAASGRRCEDARVSEAIPAIPDVRYARTAGVAIAYQRVGDGPPVVYAPHLCTIDALWEGPRSGPFLRRLAERVQLIVFNPRGTGLSDRPVGVTLESRMDDIVAVLDAEGIERVTLFGVAESANACLLFASTYPERCARLILYTPYPGLGADEADIAAAVKETRERWGDRSYMEGFAGEINPAYRSDPDQLEWFIRTQRAAASPRAAADFVRMQLATDIGDVIGSVRVPTIVVALDEHDDRIMSAGPRTVAEALPNATLVTFPGAGIDPYSRASDLIELIDRAAHDRDVAAVPDSMLATLLFTDLTDSTVLAAEMGDAAWRRTLAEHHEDVRRDLATYRGIEVDTAGDGFFCRFDGPARAIACAEAIIGQARLRGLEVRAGIHTGECEMVGDKPAGIAVHIGARLLGAARPGEILVSRTVRDLVAGSGYVFDDRGDHQLKGVPGSWQVFAVTGQRIGT
jgi:class 3 adenylate cyclase/pimeloyl-ACP methyl ester carboxylesterase